MDLENWVRNNPVPTEMYWKSEAHRQIKKFWDLAKTLGVNIQVLGHHTSKSIKLPVVELAFVNGRILLRDNFHTLEMAVQWDFAPALAYADVYPPAQDRFGETDARDWAWYLHEIDRCAGYSWRGWSEEEIADPRITRVQVNRDNGSVYWNDMTPDRKDRWLKRMVDPEWHHRDWGGRIFYEGVFGPNAKLFIGTATYLEGISDLIVREDQELFELGKRNFTLSTSWEAVFNIITAINTTHECQ